MQCLGEPTAGDQCRKRSAHVKPHEESNDRHAKVQEPLGRTEKEKRGGRSQDVKVAECVSKHDSNCQRNDWAWLSQFRLPCLPQGPRLDSDLCLVASLLPS